MPQMEKAMELDDMVMKELHREWERICDALQAAEIAPSVKTVLAMRIGADALLEQGGFQLRAVRRELPDLPELANFPKDAPIV